MPNQSAQIVANALNYIERQLSAEPRHDFAAKLDLSNIAGATGYSKFHLHRLFSVNTGQTMHSYVLRRRLTEAARQLVFSKQPLIDIAIQSGYDSQAPEMNFTLCSFPCTCTPRRNGRRKLSARRARRIYRTGCSWYASRLPVIRTGMKRTIAAICAPALPGNRHCLSLARRVWRQRWPFPAKAATLIFWLFSRSTAKRG